MSEARETKGYYQQFTTIWCSVKDDMYSPLSLDSMFVPSAELVAGLENIGFKVVKCHAHIRIEIQNEVSEENTNKD